MADLNINLNLNVNLGLDLKLAPKLTAQLRQSIGLLQLSHHDLKNIIHEHLAQNPLLKLAPADDAHHKSQQFGGNLQSPQTPQTPNYQNSQISKNSQNSQSDYGQYSPSHTNPNLNSNQQSTHLNHLANLQNSQDLVNPTGYQIYQNSLSQQIDANKISENAAQKTEAHYEKLSNTPDIVDFREDLLSQLAMMRLSQLHHALASYLVQNLDDRGFLIDELDDILQDLQKISEEIQLADLQKAHKIVKNLSPTGVGAHNALECLRLNIQEALKSLGLNQRDKLWQYQLALQLLTHIETIAITKKTTKKNTKSADVSFLNLSFSTLQQKKIARDLGVSPEKITEIIALIRRLPQQPIETVQKAFEQSDYILPDIIVVEIIQKKDEFGSDEKIYQAFLNDALVPKLSIDLTATPNLTENQQHYLKKKTQEANWLITSIEKRFDTLKKLATLIVSEQQMFFEHGEKAMQPMTMQEAANQLGIHVSTVSRIICHKYLQCKRGTYPIRYFFSKELITANGRTSSIAIKDCIKHLINKEIEGGKSSSDLLLTQKLLELGLNISRRTVAKYRKELGIQASHHRDKKSKN